MPNNMISKSSPSIAPDGMNLALSQAVLPDTQARVITDSFLDKPGLIYRRGPVRVVPGVSLPTLGGKATGIVSALNPLGEYIIGVLYGDGAGKMQTYTPTYTAAGVLSFPRTLTTTPPYFIWEAKPALHGGTLIGVTDTYGVDQTHAPSQALVFWRGGRSVNYNTGTLSVTRGAVAVTGSGTTWSTNITPGMFIFASTDNSFTTFIGTVLKVNSNTSLTLEKPSPFTCTAKTYVSQAFRDVRANVVKGRITCAITDTAVTGGDTKFNSQGVVSGYQIFRARDFAYVGAVSSVANEESLILGADAAVECDNERFIAIDPTYASTLLSNPSRVGFLTNTYAGRQWYANISDNVEDATKVWFSDPSDPEGLDISSSDGDFIFIGSTKNHNPPIRALAPTQNALIVFKDTEVWGIFGNSPSTFNVRQLEGEGCVFGMTVQPYQDGVVWAGREGIYYYNGVSTQNLVLDSLGKMYKIWLRSLSSTFYRMYSMIAQDHYFLFLENTDTPLTVYEGSTPITLNPITIAVHLPTGRVSLIRNLHLRGSITLPVDSGHRVWYIVNDGSKGIICNSVDLFEATGVDTVSGDGTDTVGPHFYIESKKFDMSEPLRKKLFKQLALNYVADNAALYLDVIPGLDGTTTTKTGDFTATTVGSTNMNYKRSKFYKRSPHLSFRLYQSGAMTNVIVGAMDIEFRPERIGRLA